jgi:hypothetical protein
MRIEGTRDPIWLAIELTVATHVNSCDVNSTEVGLCHRLLQAFDVLEGFSFGGAWRRSEPLLIADLAK